MEILYQTQDVFEAQEYFSHEALCMRIDGKNNEKTCSIVDFEENSLLRKFEGNLY